MLLTSKGMTQTDKERYKQLSGRYGNNDGICLFEDGSFMLYGYATMVPGKYRFEKELLHFYPDKPVVFELYATRNMGIGKNTRMNFQGFEEGKTYVQFNQDSVKRVFNDMANCFSAPYVYEGSEIPRQISLSHVIAKEWEETKATTESLTFTVEEGDNDFILIYNEPQRYYEPFVAIVEKSGDEHVLKLSENFGDRGIVKQVMDEDEQKQWQEILAMKAEYGFMQTAAQKEIFANRHYKIFYKADPLVYDYDKNTNQYVSKGATDNENYYRNNQYNDDRYLHKYSKLAPVKITTDSLGKGIASGSIFYSACEGDLPVYKYNGFKKEEEKNINVQAPVMIPGVPDYNVHKRVGDKVPFAVDRPDGFYTVVKTNALNVDLPELERYPSLTKADIKNVKVKTMKKSQPVIVITFTEAGKDKFKQLTTLNVNKAIAIVVNKMVITAPVVDAVITKGEVQIMGLYSLEAAKAIATQLNKP